MNLLRVFIELFIQIQIAFILAADELKIKEKSLNEKSR